MIPSFSFYYIIYTLLTNQFFTCAYPFYLHMYLSLPFLVFLVSSTSNVPVQSAKTMSNSQPTSKTRLSGATRRLPAASTVAGGRPHRIGKVAGEWKEKPTQSNARKAKTDSVKRPAKIHGDTSMNSATANRGSTAYVSSISFRENAKDLRKSNRDENSSSDSTSGLLLENSASTKPQETVPALASQEVEEARLQPSSSSKINGDVASDENKQTDKSSAVVSPFMYKPQSSNVEESPKIDSTSNERPASDSLTADFTSHANFYGQENKITVHLDIKPCITLSEVSHSRPVDQAPLQYQLSSNPKAKPDVPMTKTEMLLKRRSELLSRRRESPTRWQPSKTTDV